MARVHSMEGCALLPRLLVLLRRHVNHTQRLACARTFEQVLRNLRYLTLMGSFDVKGPPR